MNNQANTISVLNKLIETLKDGQDGFQSASENVQSSELRTVFATFSQQRSKFAGELQTLARSLGESEPETTGSVSASVHRGWINLKGTLTGRDDHAILAECEKGEDSAVADYKEALDSTELPANVREVVARQFSDVQAAHDRVRDLRDGLVSA